jgi:hypothetical protein
MTRFNSHLIRQFHARKPKANLKPRKEFFFWKDNMLKKVIPPTNSIKIHVRRDRTRRNDDIFLKDPQLYPFQNIIYSPLETHD